MKNRILSVAVVLFVVLYSTGIVPILSVQEAQALDESEFSVDVTADCNDLAEDETVEFPQNVWPLAEFEGPFRRVNGVQTIPAFVPVPPPALSRYGTTLAGALVWSIDSFAEMVGAGAYFASDNQDPPNVQIRSGDFAIREGEGTKLVAQPNQFRNDPYELYYSWWQVKPDLETVDENGDPVDEYWSLNGVVAGGQEYDEVVDDPENESKCGIMTRYRGNDSDGDYMDDDWERRYTNDSIESFLPFDDLDEDGATESRYVSNEDGTPFQIAPNSGSDPRATGLPEFVFSSTDGFFPNLEEYIHYTNPLDPDTDDDGFTDGDDVMGVGQIVLEYTPQAITGTNITYEVNVMGESNLFNEEEFPATQIVGFRANSSIVLGGRLRAFVDSDHDNVLLGEPFRLRAVEAGTIADPVHLNYEWIVSTSDGEFLYANNNEDAVGDLPCERVSFGQVLECTLDVGQTAVGESLEVSVTISDDATGQVAVAYLRLPVGGQVALISEPTLVPQYPIDQTGEFPAAPEGSDEIGERWVQVSAELPEINASTDYFQYDFSWWVEDERQLGSCSTEPIPFEAVGDQLFAAPNTDLFEVCGLGSRYFYFQATGTNSQNYDVVTRVKSKASGDDYGFGSETIYTDRTPTPYPGQEEEIDSDIIATNTSALASDPIVATASIVEKNQNHEYEYRWSVDGQLVASDTDRQLEFTAAPNTETYEIGLEVVEKNAGLVVSRMSDEKIVQVTTVTAFDKWANRKSAQISLARDALDSPLLKYFFFPLVGGAGIVIILITLARSKHGFTLDGENK